MGRSHAHLLLLSGEEGPEPSPLHRRRLDLVLGRLREKHPAPPEAGQILLAAEAPVRDPVEAAVLAALSPTLALTWGQLRIDVPHRHETAYAALQQLVLRGEVIREGEGRHGSPFRYRRR
jgi:hypothetical protein